MTAAPIADVLYALAPAVGAFGIALIPLALGLKCLVWVFFPPKPAPEPLYIQQRKAAEVEQLRREAESRPECIACPNCEEMVPANPFDRMGPPTGHFNYGEGEFLCKRVGGE